MKNFYEVMGIDINKQLKVKVKLVEHNSPTYLFTVNNKLVNSDCIIEVNLLDDLIFHCIPTVGAVEIAKITINEHEILPIYQHLANPPTNWITEKWQLVIPGPFYFWYHQITGQGWIA